MCLLVRIAVSYSFFDIAFRVFSLFVKGEAALLSDIYPRNVQCIFLRSAIWLFLRLNTFLVMAGWLCACLSQFSVINKILGLRCVK